MHFPFLGDGVQRSQPSWLSQQIWDGGSPWGCCHRGVVDGGPESRVASLSRLVQRLPSVPRGPEKTRMWPLHLLPQ